MKAIIQAETDALFKTHPHPDAISYGKTVLLTGSTGSFSRHILQQFLLDTRVTHIYCLNRSDNAKERQAKLTAVDLPESRIPFFRADLGEADLGLPPSDFQTLFSNVDTIIHNS